MLRSETVAFLQSVLPPEGYYVAVIFDVANPKAGIDFPRQVVCETIEHLAGVLLDNDALGRTVYHACASFKDPRAPKPRAAANAARVRSLWIDVDAGPGKPYVDAPAAAQAVVGACGALGLPGPWFVASGAGLHCYWPLDRSLSPDEWLPYATGLKHALVEHGLKIGPERTADIASVLRTPGTHHRKNGEKEVVCGPLAGPYNLENFSVLRRPNSVRSTSSPRRDSSLISRILNTTSYSAAYADPIADGCGQLRAFRQSGRLPEPVWYACLGVLSRCEDGEVKAHEWSKNGFPGYRYDETQQRVTRTKELSGATTCAKLHDVSPGICPSCPHFNKINSPIALGYRGLYTGAAQPAPSIPAVVATIVLPVLPPPFSWSDRGQLRISSEAGKDGDEKDLIVVEHPAFLDSVQIGEIDHGSFSYLFRRYLPNDGWKDVTIDAKELHGAQGVAVLAGRGIVIHDGKAFLKYARVAVDEWHKDNDLEMRYDQFGWKHEGDTSFLFGGHLYTPAGPVEAIGGKEVTTRCQWLGPKRGGGLPAWTEAADSLFASDMEAISAAVLASFAAPLMKFQAPNEGGAILHLYTPESGRGKTTALQGAWTVWGEKYGLNLTNDDTKVSKPIALGTLGNLPVIYDELRDKDPEVIKKFVVMFTEGRDRMRGMVDGSIRHTKAMWQTVLLSAANASLLDQLTGDGTDAPAFRVLELSTVLRNDMDKAKADRLKAILDNNAGHAGDAYLRYLLQPEVLAWSRAALEKWTGDIWTATGLGNEHRFRVRLVGAIAVAAALVNKLDILHFNTDRVIQWLVDELRRSKQQGAVSGRTTLERAIEALGQFINEHYGETLAVPDRFRPKTSMLPLLKPHNRLSIRYEVASRRVFIAESVFRDWAVKKQMSPRTVLAMLKEHGVIVDYKRNITLSAGTDIPGAQVLSIEVNADHPVMSGLVASIASTLNDNINGAHGR